MNAYLRAPFDFYVRAFWLHVYKCTLSEAQGVLKRVLDCLEQELTDGSEPHYRSD